MEFPVQVADVSHWQGKVDFNVMKSRGVRGVFLKASESSYRDPKLIINSANAADAGLHLGYYHFFRANYDAKVQANFFWNTVKNLPVKYGYVCDTETFDGVSGQTVLLRVKTFCEEIERLSGTSPFIYTAPYIWKSYGGWGSLGTWASKYRLWIANYGVSYPMQTPPWPKPTFWQYASNQNGPYYGTESLEVDMNYYIGTEAEYNSAFGVAQPNPSPSVISYLNETDPFLRGLGYQGSFPPVI